MIWNYLFPTVRKTERERFKFFFLLSTFLCLGQTLGLVGAESLLLAHMGASVLPLVFILASVVTVGLSLAYAFGVDRNRNDNYFIQLLIIFTVLVGGATLCSGVLPAARQIALVALFCLYYATFAISTSHFWTFTADFFDSLQNKRLFPLFTAGASLGGVCGGVLASLLATRQGGAETLLWGWVASFLLAAAWLRHHRSQLRRWGPLEIEELDETSMDGMKSAIRFLRGSRMGLFMVLSALFMVTSLFVSQYLYSDLFVQTFPAPDDLAKFFGIFLALTNAGELLLELRVTPWLLARFGVANANLLHALLTMVSFVGLAVAPGLGSALFARLNRETFENAIGAPIRNLVYNALPGRLRGRLRAFLEGMVVYSGMAMAGLFLFFWERFQPSAGGTQLYLTLGGLALGLGFFTANFALRREYFDQLLNSVQEGRIEPGESSSILENLPHDRVLDLWDTLIDAEIQSPVLNKLAQLLAEQNHWTSLRVGFTSSHPQVRLLSLQALQGAAPRRADPLIKQALTDANVELRLFALQASAKDPAVIRRALDDDHPEVRAEAAALSDPPHRERLQAMLKSSDLEERLAALKRLHHTMRDEATPFLKNGHSEEIVTALSSLTRMGHPPTTERLTELYAQGDQPVRIAVLESVASDSKGIESQQVHHLLEKALADPSRPVRKVALSTFIAVGGEAQTFLRDFIQTTDSSTCHDAIAALSQVGDEADKALFSAESLVRARRAWSHRLEASVLAKSEPTEDAVRFLILALNDSADRELTTCFRLLEAQEQTRVVRSVESVLRFANSRIRTDALEVLSNLGNREATSLLVHLLEDGDLAERANTHSGKVPAARDLTTLVEDLRSSPDRWLNMAARAIADPAARRDPTFSEESKLMERLLMLQSVPLFAPMTLEQREAIHSCLTEQVYTKGEVIFNEGDIGDEMYIVASGEVEIILNLETPNPLLLATVKTGSYFGEMSVIDQKPRSAAARVSSEARLFVLKAEQLKELVYLMPEIALTIFRVLSDRVRRSDKRLDGLTRTDSSESEPKAADIKS